MTKTSNADVLDNLLAQSTSYVQWYERAQRYDQLSGREEWRHIDASDYYDYQQIKLRLDRLRTLRDAKDYQALLFTLNEGVHGNIGGIGHAKLYRYSKLGTKKLIENYISEVDTSLGLLASLPSDIISTAKKRDFFNRASICFGHSSLMLSGGGVLGYQHIGVVKALLSEGVLPNVISGSSAGSIFAGFLACHDNAEITELLHKENVVHGAGYTKRVGRLRVEDVAALIAQWVPDLTFQEAFDKTGRKISVSIAPVDPHQGSRLLNAITSPNVSLRSGIMASCAVPGIFPAVMLMAENAEGMRQPYLPSQRWVDGSFSDDLPAKRLSRLYGTNHSIVSMVNPIATPFLRADSHNGNSLSRIAGGLGISLSRELLGVSRSLAQKGGDKLTSLNAVLNSAHSVIDQNYLGDINIVPSFKQLKLRKVLSHVSEQELLGLIQCGEQSTYPHIEAIRLCTQISRTLEAILDQLNR